MESMIPYTKEIADQIMAGVLKALIEYGLIEPPESDAAEEYERVADNFMALLDEQNLTNDQGDAVAGRCLVMPSRGEWVTVLFATPCPVDEYDEQLKRRPSPVRFERTADGTIVLPERWLLSKIEDLADNPMVPEEAREAARRASRTLLMPDGLPVQTPTVAITVRNHDGSTTVLEALPPGLVITLEAK